MAYYKIPIIEKVYEAYSALADGRVELAENKTFVTSSDHAKTYTVVFENGTYVSNDNMSYFKQTIGYPIIATMMLKNEIAINEEVVKFFAGINWKSINTKLKNNYVLAASTILEEMKEGGVDTNFVREETEKVYSQIKLLKLEYKKSKTFPPKSK